MFLLVLKIVAFGLGLLCLLLDVGGRLFGSYASKPLARFTRISIAVFIGMVYSLPFLVVSVIPDTNFSKILNILVFTLGFFAIICFLFPLHFGIKKGIQPSLKNRKNHSLTPSVSLRDESILVDHSMSIDTLQVLVLSDLHCNSDNQLAVVQQSMEKVKSYNIDFLFILGDLTENKEYLRELFKIFKEINTQYGKFIVRGNHDYEGGRDKIIEQLATEYSIELLNDRARYFEKLNVTLIGTERPWCKTVAIPKVIGFPIGLSHTPDNIQYFSKHEVPIILAGHTHGGKIHFPFIGSILVPSLFGRFLDYGWFRCRNTSMFITKGYGYFPGTAGEKGEMLRLTIHRK